jgi:hypothetical protein
MGDQHDAEIYTGQHTVRRRERHPCPLRDSKPQFQQAIGPDPCIKWLGNRHQLTLNIINPLKPNDVYRVLPHR